MRRDGWEPVPDELPAGAHTAELRYPGMLSRVVLSGCLQVACPGYGVVDLHPGDQLTLEAGLVHDLTAQGGEPAAFLAAARQAGQSPLS